MPHLGENQLWEHQAFPNFFQWKRETKRHARSSLEGKIPLRLESAWLISACLLEFKVAFSALKGNSVLPKNSPQRFFA